MSAPSPTPSTPPLENAPHESPQGHRPKYQASINRYARGLIARIQKNQDDVEAIRLLELHYVSTGDHLSLVNLLEGWGDTLKDPRLAADAYLRAADATLVGVGDRVRAKTLYERALSRDASHVEALDRVLRLLADAGDHEREKRVLKYVAYQLGERSDAPAALPPQDGQHLASVLYRLGVVYETHFGDAGKAAANYRKAIEVNPKLVPAIIAARRIYADVGNVHAVAMLYDFEIDATPAPEDKRGLLLALAELREHEQHDLDEAVIALRRALKALPGDVEALRKLGEVLVRRSERTPQDRDPDGEQAADDRRRAAEVFYQVSLGVPERSAQSYLDRALTLNPAHEKAATALRELSVTSNREPQQSDESLPTSDELAAASGRPGQRVATDGGLEMAPLEEAAATVPVQPVRDSVETWLQDEYVESESALSTGELLPIGPFRAQDDGIVSNLDEENRISTAPPRALADKGLGMFPPSESLRAPRMPSFGPEAVAKARETVSSVPRPAASTTPPPAAGGSTSPAPAPRRSVRPPPPSRRPSRSLPPPPPPTEETAHAGPSHAPPAYAEIPGASSDDLTPARMQRPSSNPQPFATEPQGASQPRNAEPTLIAWRLPVVAADDDPPAPTTPPDAAKRVSAQPSHSAKPSLPNVPAARSTPYPLHAGSSPLRSAQDERVAELVRATRERASEPKPPVAQAVHAPIAAFEPTPSAVWTKDAPTPTTAAAATSASSTSAPTPTPVLSPPRAVIVEGELLFDPARGQIEVNIGATTESNFYVGFSNRLADGGVFVATYSALPIGSEVELLITLPGNFSARAHGRVRLRRDTFGDDVPGMCVELEALSVDALALFERFAKKRQPLFIED